MVNKRRHNARIDLSILIVNYNVRDYLHHALESLLRASKGLKTEVIVADNASDDGSVEMVRRRFPKVKVIANSENLGFAKANNLAMQHARGEFLLFINPDTVVQEDTLRVMVAYLRDHGDVGLAGCKILNPDGSFQPACRRSFPTPWVAFTKLVGLSNLLPKSQLFGRYNLTYKDLNRSYEVDAVSGSFMMVRRDVVERIGGLDEDFFMYGEDLDWCYRIQSAGWKIAYVHSTSIIHYKGESTKRSNIDEIKTFYEAMYLFVEKHFRHSALFNAFLKLGIGLTSFGAFLKLHLTPLKSMLVDFVAVNISLILAEFIWRGDVFRYPHYAYPIVYVVPAVIVIVSLYAAGVYTVRRMSVSRSMVASVVAFVVIAAITAFFKQYAFSRMIVAVSGALCFVLLPGWRFVLRMISGASSAGRSTLFGKRTLIIGADEGARELLHRLRNRLDEGYEVVGFVDTSHKRIGERIDDVAVVGSIATVHRLVKEYRVSDVIFSPDSLSYGQILTVVAGSSGEPVNFHLVPDSMEVMIGKASIESLGELPLVQISYNLQRPLNRFMKRAFDVVFSLALLITGYPFVYFRRLLHKESHPGFILNLPSVLRGTKSLVGPPAESSRGLVHLGTPGLTGLVQLQNGRALTREEADRYNLYYARNQSVLLDLEILLKTWLQRRQD